MILRARLLRDQQDDEQTSRHFAKAAGIEVSLSDRCVEQGLVQKALIHRFSAASCWVHASRVSYRPVRRSFRDYIARRPVRAATGRDRQACRIAHEAE